MDIVNYILGNRYKGSGGYDKTTTLSWDGVLTDDEKTFGPYGSDEEQVYFYKISDEPLSSDAFRNSITTIALTKTGEIRSLDAAKDHCIIGTDDELLMNLRAMTLNVFIEKDMFKRGLFISKIIKKSDDNDAIYVKSISYKTPIPIQNKFIPLAEDGVKGGIVGTAKTDDMLTPVGIDENGKLFAESQFYDTRETKDLVMTFDGNLDGKEYIETEPGTYLVKYSDYVPPYDSVNYIHTTFASNGSEQTGNLTKDNLFYMSDDNLIAYGINGGALNFIYSGSMTIGDKTMTQGAWIAHVKSDDVTNIYKEITINYNVGELKQIDKKYIPEQKPLTFTGAVTGAYDGSTPLTVNIPEAGISETAVDNKVSSHNTSKDSHNDLRLLIEGLSTRLNALADSDDTTLDQMSEVVAYIKSNKSLIDAITTSKINVSDIIDNLTTNVSNKPLSAAQGVALKALIDGITIPEALPNPNALTFTGAVTGTYDGSEAVTVDIPSGGNGGAEVTEAVKIAEFTINAEMAEATSIKLTAEEYPTMKDYNVFWLSLDNYTNGTSPWIQLSINDKVIYKIGPSNNNGFRNVIHSRNGYFFAYGDVNNPSLIPNDPYSIDIAISISFISEAWKYMGELKSIKLGSYTKFMQENSKISLYGWNE